ncbi:GerW family sporulation protein [Ructibacterium gallinarum]|uniref:GerW family sporulation protein n=1 Tax=Ructibacterium gallinarum TaxID=2779355 RepID=A0A9D5M4J8_9FIRM|nr:GerW family sporulation protein [Ructibacterium gallinarum]MBE5039317.1 GerW family sporulation protein [Ructibacterium gallinarum]
MAENKHPIEGIMYTALQGLKEMIDVNTIVGDAITTPDGTVIIPISKVALGFGVGGSEFEKYRAGKVSGEEPKNMFGGATGGGISLTPEAFLVVGNGKIRMISVTPQNSIYDRLMDLAPEAIDRVTELFHKEKKVEVTPEDLDEEDFSAQNPDA